jgi:hypothetical protein
MFDKEHKMHRVHKHGNGYRGCVTVTTATYGGSGLKELKSPRLTAPTARPHSASHLIPFIALPSACLCKRVSV